MVCRKALLVIVVMSVFLPAGVGAKELNVLALHSFHAGYAWTADQQSGFLQALDASAVADDIVFRVEYLDAEMTQGGPDYLQQYFRYLKQKYAGFSPDLIYATDDPAVAFLQQYRQRLFPDALVAYSGLSDPDLEARLEHGAFFGVFDLTDVAGTIGLALRLHPELTTLRFIGDASAASRRHRTYFENEAARFFPQVRLDFFDSPSLGELETYLEGLSSPLWIVNSLGAVRDATGSPLSVPAVMKRLGQVGEFKILVMEDSYLQQGALGGAVNRGWEQGVQAGFLVRERLFGEVVDGTDAIFGPVSNPFLFNYAQLARFGLTASDLPPRQHDCQPARIVLDASSFQDPGGGRFCLAAIVRVGFLVAKSRVSAAAAK